MKTAYAVIAERYSDLTYFASVFRIEAGRNIYHDCMNNGDMVSMLICESKKEAQRIADDWNETWRKEGTLATFQTLSCVRRAS